MRIAFAGTVLGKPYNIYLISAEGGSPEQLISGESDQADVGWSADRIRYIAANPASNSEGGVLFDFITQKWTELTKLPMCYPNWSRDSKYIYFDTGGFYRVRISDHTLEQLVSTKNIRRAGLYGWTGLGPDDSLLLLRDVGTEEIYALDWQVP